MEKINKVMTTAKKKLTKNDRAQCFFSVSLKVIFRAELTEKQTRNRKTIINRIGIFSLVPYEPKKDRPSQAGPFASDGSIIHSLKLL